MKTIAIGDTHGRDDWKKIIDRNIFDRVIWMGDYFDTHEDIPATQQIFVFNELMEYKKTAGDKAVFLIGNHDYHYLRGITEHYSGYQAVHAFDIQYALHEALDKKYLQVCHLQDDILFTHAGVTKTWATNHKIIIEEIEASLYELFEKNPVSFGFTPCENRKLSPDPYGDEICQSPLWVRPASLLTDKITGYRQVVGHTVHRELTITDGVTFIDCLPTSGEYLVVEDGEFRIEKIINF